MLLRANLSVFIALIVSRFTHSDTHELIFFVVNPCQGHLLELKLAAINALEYEEFWQLFGEGRHSDFKRLLDEKIGPHLSAHAYAFWKRNASAFDQCFYKKGYSG
jgi:betaine lipid synthase